MRCEAPRSQLARAGPCRAVCRLEGVEGATLVARTQSTRELYSLPEPLLIQSATSLEIIVLAEPRQSWSKERAADVLRRFEDARPT